MRPNKKPPGLRTSSDPIDGQPQQAVGWADLPPSLDVASLMLSRSLLFLAILAAAPFLMPVGLLAQDTVIPLPPAGTASARLGVLETEYVQNRFREQPSAATQAGIHTEDRRLPDLSAAGFARRNATA